MGQEFVFHSCLDLEAPYSIFDSFQVSFKTSMPQGLARGRP